MIKFLDKNKFMFICFVVIVSTLFINEAKAQTKDALDYSEMAKHRTYPGGVDESDLKLQSGLSISKTKKNPVPQEDVGGY